MQHSTFVEQTNKMLHKKKFIGSKTLGVPILILSDKLNKVFNDLENVLKLQALIRKVTVPRGCNL